MWLTWPDFLFSSSTSPTWQVMKAVPFVAGETDESRAAFSFQLRSRDPLGGGGGGVLCARVGWRRWSWEARPPSPVQEFPGGVEPLLPHPSWRGLITKPPGSHEQPQRRRFRQTSVRSGLQDRTNAQSVPCLKKIPPCPSLDFRRKTAKKDEERISPNGLRSLHARRRHSQAAPG